MTQIERIKAEIERRRSKAEWEKNEAEGVSHDGYCMHLAEENLCMFLLDFIDSLEQEPQGLDEAAEKYTDNPDTYAVWTEHYGDFATVDDIELIEKAFKAGAKWMREQGQTKEGEVFDNNEFIKFPDGSYIDLRPDMNHMAFKVKDGDKVIVQIRKEDERG